MSFTLGEIEAKLSSFFENDLFLFKKKDSSLKIISRLMDIMEQGIIEKIDKKYAPNQYTVLIDETFHKLNHTKLTEFLKKFLRENADQNGYHLTGPIQVNFKHVSTTTSGINIHTGFSSIQSGRTIKLEGQNNKASIEKSNEPLGCLILWDEEVVDILRSPFNIGRDLSNDLVIDNLKVSRKHARLIKSGNDVWIHDLHSTLGTFINDEKLESKILKNGDVLKLAEAEIIFLNSNTHLQKHSSKTRKIDT